ITDCMFSNNVGCTYAITFAGTYYRCKFIHNRITNWGGVSNGAYYNCIVDYNYGGSYQTYRPYAFVNGVVGSNCTSYCASGSTGETQRRYYNSIILGSYWTITACNCLLVGQDIGSNNILDGSRKVTAAQVNLDADYQPLPGSVALDAGTNEFYAASYSTSAETEWATNVWEAESPVDHVKNTRIQGARIDIGAYEFDPTPKSFYVDPVNGDDGNDGRQPTSAFKTLAGVMAHPWLGAGDTVLLKPGTYAEGVVTNGDARTLNRVVVKAGVTVEGLGEKPEDVVIRGADAPLENQVVNAYGCGTNAVRCAKLVGGCVLKNLTLAGGRVYVNGTTSSSGYDGCAAAHCTGEGNYLINCLITNCVGLIHAIAGDEEVTVKTGGRSGLIRCRVSGNRTISYAGLQRLNLYNCAIYGNSGSYSVHDCYNVVNCTIMDTSSAFRESSSQVTYCTAYNCVIASAQDSTLTPFYRCYFPSAIGSYAGVAGYHLYDGSLVKQQALEFKDGTFIPKFSCCLTDAGENGYLTNFPSAFPEERTVDLYGQRRIARLAIDVGAGELPDPDGLMISVR
ncbi:MAG TPA: choice-of-anchor Q domain-containing protein, partial [Opitutales bacterium]|nr:choice-of-anchor Q domain-containing protein [Opitutales bacterium]